jgi:hypothetical protein
MRESRKLAQDADRWATSGAQGKRPAISTQRRESIIELSFLRAFLAWEAFLSESFILYLLGHEPRSGGGPRRYYFPPNRDMAVEWLSEGRDYAKWTNASEVADRARRFFKDGYTFTTVLRANQFVLSDAAVIRNAIAHEAISARLKFENVVRRELGVLPANRTAGAFLGMSKPTAVPPISFLEFYIDALENCALQITPP